MHPSGQGGLTAEEATTEGRLQGAVIVIELLSFSQARATVKLGATAALLVSQMRTGIWSKETYA